MKRIKRTLAALLTVVLTLALLGEAVFADNSEQPVWPEEGAIQLSKSQLPLSRERKTHGRSHSVFRAKIIRRPPMSCWSSIIRTACTTTAAWQRQKPLQTPL